MSGIVGPPTCALCDWKPAPVTAEWSHPVCWNHWYDMGEPAAPPKVSEAGGSHLRFWWGPGYVYVGMRAGYEVVVSGSCPPPR